MHLLSDVNQQSASKYQKKKSLENSYNGRILNFSSQVANYQQAYSTLGNMHFYKLLVSSLRQTYQNT